MTGIRVKGLGRALAVGTILGAGWVVGVVSLPVAGWVKGAIMVYPIVAPVLSACCMSVQQEDLSDQIIEMSDEDDE